MRQIELRKVKQEEIFRLTNSETAPLWVRGYYERSERKYECYKYDNYNHETFLKGSRQVFVD